jgi:integrase
MDEYPALKQRPNGYWYIYWDRHERYSLKTKDKATAQSRFALVLRDKREATLIALAPKPDTHLSAFIKQYVEWRGTGDGKTPGTVAQNESILKSLLSFMRDRPMSHIRPRDIDAFHVHLRSARKGSRGRPALQGLKSSTLNMYIDVLRTAFKRALRWGFITVNPYEDVKHLPQDEVEAPFLSRADIEERFLPALRTYPEPFQNLMLMYLYTGARRQELCKMTAGQIKKQGGRVYLEISTGKTHRSRLVPVLSQEALAVIERLPRVGVLFPGCTNPNCVTAKAKKLLRECGLGHLHLHSLRHTTASHLAMAGVGDKALMLLLGHTQPRTAKRYQHLNPGYLEEVMGKLSFTAATPTLSVVKPRKKKSRDGS